ncbi:MAG: hypothetical protein WAV93_00005 [Bacteroidales bacterium]
MRTITLKDFTDDFMEISKKLTHSELRMLYLLITEPQVVKLTQSEFAERISTDRRTINLGYKKLRENNLILFSEAIIGEGDQRKKVIYLEDFPSDVLRKALESMVSRFSDYYHPSGKKSIVINEDFYTYMIREWALDNRLENKKAFINKAIKEHYPDIRFYTEQKPSDFPTEAWYNANRHINFSISDTRALKIYQVKLDTLFDFLHEHYFLSEEEVLQIIKTDFPNLIIKGNRLVVPRHYDLNAKNVQ